jgi:hypothetical protein
VKKDENGSPLWSLARLRPFSFWAKSRKESYRERGGEDQEERRCQCRGGMKCNENELDPNQ